MEPTEQQCSEALCALYNRIYGEDYSYEKEFDVLYTLIEAHYKNPPMQWDDIKEDEPIYDNKAKRWIMVINKRNLSNKFFKRKTPLFFAFNTLWCDTDSYEYEDNRYFRREVLE